MIISFWKKKHIEKDNFYDFIWKVLEKSEGLSRISLVKGIDDVISSGRVSSVDLFCRVEIQLTNFGFL